MLTAIEIINRALSFEGCVYWYGGKREVASISLAKRLKKENPKVWTDNYYRKAIKDIDGKTVACDCSGLVCYCYGIPDIGSYQIRDRYKEWKGKARPGMIAWRPGHVAIVINEEGYIAEMKSLNDDFKRSRTIKSAAMEKILYDENVDYDAVQTIGWHQDVGEAWWYAYGKKDGEYYKNSWADINGRRFYFNEYGYAETGLTKVGRDYYVFSDEGMLVSDNEGRLSLWQTTTT